MSLLVNNTLANPQTSFYAAAGGAGPTPSTPSELQSPASILPDGGGDVLLNMIATPGAANTSTALLVANGGTASILLNGGPNAGTGYEIAANNVASGSYLQIGGQQAISPMIQLDNNFHELTLGDNFPVLSQVSLAAAIISADAYVASGGGGLVLNNTGAVLKGGTNSGITVTPTQTTIVGNYKYVQSIGTVSNATPILINFPVQTGLYTLMMGTTSTDPFSVNSCVSVNAYFLSGTGFVSGGNVSAVLNGTLGGNEYAQFYTNSNNIYFRYVAGSTATISNMFCRVVQLTGNLGF
jgi:hypothetical protein